MSQVLKPAIKLAGVTALSHAFDNNHQATTYVAT